MQKHAYKDAKDHLLAYERQPFTKRRFHPNIVAIYETYVYAWPVSAYKGCKNLEELRVPEQKQ